MSRFDKAIKFGSLDNQHDPLQVGVDNLVIAANIDIMDDESCQRRGGQTATAVAGADLHSLWGNIPETIGMMMDGVSLYQLDTVPVASLVGAMPTSDEVFFSEFNNVIACVSNAAVKFVSGSAFVTFALPGPLDGEYEFKALTSGWTGGNCVAQFNGHLLVGTDQGVMFSDQYSIGQYDTRDYLIQIPFAVKHIAVVDTGIWVCGWTGIAFLPGDAIGDLTFTEKIDIGVLALTLSRRGEWKNNERVSPIYAALCDTGVFLLEENSMTPISNDTYRPPIVTIASAIMRDINGTKQFLSSFAYSSDPHIYKNKTITVDTEEG